MAAQESPVMLPITSGEEIVSVTHDASITTSTSASVSATASVVRDVLAAGGGSALIMATAPKKSLKKRERKNKTSEAFMLVRDKILQSAESSFSLSQSNSDDMHDWLSDNLSDYPSSPFSNIKRPSLNGTSAKSTALDMFQSPLISNLKNRSSDLYAGSTTSEASASSVYTAAYDHTPDERLHSPINGTILETELSGLAMTDPLVLEYAQVGNNGKVQYDLDSLDPRISILGTMSIFAERPDLLVKLRPSIQFTLFEAGTQLQKQGELTQTLYWILGGNCTVSQNVSFVEVLTDGEWIIKHSYKEVKPQGPDEKLIFKNIESQNLDPGSWFPYLSGIEPSVPLTKSDLLKNHSVHTCDCTVTAESRIMVAQISLEDFVEVVSVPMLYNLHQRTSIYRFKHEFLREEYLAQSETNEKRSKFPMTNSISISLYPEPDQGDNN